MESPVRRSSRARRTATTYYDEAAARERERRKTVKEKNKDDGDNDTDSADEDKDPSASEAESEDSHSDNDSDGDSDSDSDASVAKAPPKTKKKKTTVTPNKRSPAVVKRQKAKAKESSRKTATKTKAKTKTKANTVGRPTKATGTVAISRAFSKPRITMALKMLSKSVLNNHSGSNDNENENDNNDETMKDETPETSLVAALLASARPVPGITSTMRPKNYYYQAGGVGNDASSTSNTRDKRTNAIVGLCLPQLDGIVRHLIRTTEHEGPHELHRHLLNLLFRSVGGSTRTNIPAQTDLDELEDDDWDDLISKVVTVMKNESDADQTLLIADDDGDDDGTIGPLNTRQTGIVVYRTLYKEFWYRLGHVLLAHSPSPAVAMVSEEDDDDENEEEDDNDDEEDSDSNSDKSDNDSDSDSDDVPIKKRFKRKSKSKNSKPKKKRKKKASPKAANPTPQGFSSNRFQLEKVRDLILRMTELVSVGQPDLRAAGTLAILQLSKACVERTVELEQKIKVASRQLRVASKNGSHRKQQALQHHLDNWKRHKAELEEIVEGPVFQGVFIHRYRDTNDRIRRDCMRALSTISLIRPDIFLVDTYLKYFGWMASDKSPCVRVAALEGLSAPFREATTSVSESSASTSASTQTPFPIDVRVMHNVTLKFLARIVDCTDDAQSLRVQELAIKLILGMLREEFLDEWEDDVGWDKINLKAVDALSSPRVRRDALYFVMDQLDAFDTDGRPAKVIGEAKQLDQLVAIARWCANKLCDGFIPIDKMNIELVDCIVQSILDMPDHKQLVSNWPMMLKAIRSEHPKQGSANEREEIATQRILLRILATSAKLELRKVTATETDKLQPAVVRKRRRSSDSGTEPGSLEQLSTALLKNLPHLLGVFKSDVMSLRDVTKLPPTILASVLGLPSRKADFSNLVKTLCQLYLDSTDAQTLRNIAHTLAQWVEGDHTRKAEVKINLKRLSGALQDRLMELFRESDPEEVASMSVSQKSKGTSKRSLSLSRTRRSPTRFSPRSSSRSPQNIGSPTDTQTQHTNTDGGSTIGASSAMFLASPEADAEHSISLVMLRWNILLMQCQAKYLFEKGLASDGQEDDEDEIEGLFFTISEAMGKRLSDRMPTRDRNLNQNRHPHMDDETTDASTAVTTQTDTKTIWRDHDPEVHEAVAITIQRALKVMLIIVSYELSDTLIDRSHFETSIANANENSDAKTQDMEIDEYNFPILKLRDNLVKLLGLCFDQHLPDIEGVDYRNEQHEFAESVQASAGQVASDLRTLFPFDWSKAADPVRRALALTTGDDFTFLLSGFARWFQSREDRAEIDDDEENIAAGTVAASSKSLVREAILPLARVTTMNFDGFFRKEAAMILQHISGSGSLASQTVLALSKTLKKTNPVRMLESQMACLRLAFEHWLDTEPVVPEDTMATDEEIQAFEEAEQRHLDSFASMEQVSSKLSSTLGVAGRLGTESLKKSILGFVREGIRYSFDGAESNQQDDDLVVGSRLAFLLILSKYSIFIKKEKSHMELLSDFVIEKESELRRHPEFEEVHNDDLNALADFKKSLGIKRVPDSSFVGSTADDRSFSVAATPSPSTAASGGSSRRGTMSALSKGSRASRRSGMSAQSELSPLYEDDAEKNGSGSNNDDDGDDDGDDNVESDGSPTPQKRRRLTLNSASSHRADTNSVGSSITNTKSKYSRGTIPEENEQGESDSESGVNSEE